MPESLAVAVLHAGLRPGHVMPMSRADPALPRLLRPRDARPAYAPAESGGRRRGGGRLQAILSEAGPTITCLGHVIRTRKFLLQTIHCCRDGRHTSLWFDRSAQTRWRSSIYHRCTKVGDEGD